MTDNHETAQCPNCRAPLESDAVSCPNCGWRPTSERSTFFWTVIFFFVGAPLAWMATCSVTMLMQVKKDPQNVGGDIALLISIPTLLVVVPSICYIVFKLIKSLRR